MIKLLIHEIDGNNYFLRDKSNKIYNLKIKFYDLIELPKINEYLFIHEYILNEKNTLLRLGPIDSKYGRKITSSNDKDLIIVASSDKEIYLKRYYG